MGRPAHALHGFRDLRLVVQPAREPSTVEVASETAVARPVLLPHQLDELRHRLGAPGRACEAGAVEGGGLEASSWPKKVARTGRRRITRYARRSRGPSAPPSASTWLAIARPS